MSDDTRAPREGEADDDLRRVLENPAIVVSQDEAVFDLIAKWRKARAGTESAGPSDA